MDALQELAAFTAQLVGFVVIGAWLCNRTIWLAGVIRKQFRQ